jgi:hypothetical protein
MKILGREPAAIVGAVQAVLVLGVSFGWFAGIGLHTQGDVALVVAVLAGIGAIILAIATSETLLAPVVELFKASLALGAIYGLHITTEQTGLAIATITAIITAFQRTQVSPTVVQLRPRDQRGAIALPSSWRRAA